MTYLPTLMTDKQSRMARRTIARLEMAVDGLSDYANTCLAPEERAAMNADHSINVLQNDLREYASYLRMKWGA